MNLFFRLPRHHWEAPSQRTACGRMLTAGVLTNANGGDVTCRACQKSLTAAARYRRPLPAPADPSAPVPGSSPRRR